MIATPWLPGLLDAAAKSTVLLLATLAVVLLLRRTSAATRHLVWTLGIVGVLALPVIGALSPWRLAVVPRFGATVTPPSAPRTAPEWTTTPAAPAPPAADADAEAPMVTRRAANDGSLPAAIAQPLTESNRAVFAPGVVGWLLFALWLAVAILLLGRVVAGMRVAKRVIRRGESVDDPAWTNALLRTSRRLALDRPVRLVRNREVTMPMTAGVVWPVVVLPPCDDWSRDRREAVLLHELAHVKRGDLLVHFVAQLACAIYWFHPLVWIAARRLRQESERACDDLVLASGTRPSTYADHLLSLVRRAGRRRAPAGALPMAQRSDFEGRLLAILEPHLERHPPSRGGMLAAAAVGLLALPLATIAPVAPAEPTAGGEQTAAIADPAAFPPPEPEAFGQPAERLTGAEPGAAAYADARREALVDIDSGAALLLTPDGPEPVVAPEERASPAAKGKSQVRSQHDARVAMALVEALRDADVSVRLSAAHALGDLQDSAAVLALMRAVTQDPDAGVRKTAAWALGEIEDARAVPALTQALTSDDDEEVRRMAAWALGEIEDPSAIDGLSVGLRDTSREVRAAAIRALGEIEDARAIPAITLALRDEDPEIRKHAAWALGEIEDPRAVEPLFAALGDASAEVRRQAAWALGEIEDRRAVPGLTRALQDEDVEVRKMAVWALGEIEDPTALEPLTAALRDANPEIRSRAAWALGELEDRRAVEALVAALRDESIEVRDQAVWALGEIGDPRAAEGLALALQDAQPAIRRKAAWAMGEINLRTAPPALMAALQDGDVEVKRQAIHALAEIEDPASVPALVSAARDTDTRVRKMALYALSEIGGVQAYEMLLEAIKDEDPEIRRWAARALGNR